MKWVKFRIKTITEAEDIIISTLYDIGLEGAQIEDHIPLTAWEKEQMFVDILPEGPADDGIAYLSFFVEEKEKKVALVGGGVGTFPLISVLQQYGDSKEISAYIGYRNKNAVCGEKEFAKAHKFVAVTDDGSYGEKMNAVQAFEKDLLSGNRPDVVVACGPVPMLRALKAVTEKHGLLCFVSLEERMGCGIGACVVCVCEKTNGARARVCKDGPVFNANEVIL